MLNVGGKYTAYFVGCQKLVELRGVRKVLVYYVFSSQLLQKTEGNFQFTTITMY